MIDIDIVFAILGRVGGGLSIYLTVFPDELSHVVGTLYLQCLCFPRVVFERYTDLVGNNSCCHKDLALKDKMHNKLMRVAS